MDPKERFERMFARVGEEIKECTLCGSEDVCCVGLFLPGEGAKGFFYRLCNLCVARNDINQQLREISLKLGLEKSTYERRN